MHCAALWCNYSLVRGRDCARAHIHTHALSPSLSLSLWLWLALSHSISHVAHSPSFFFLHFLPLPPKTQAMHGSFKFTMNRCFFRSVCVGACVHMFLCVCVCTQNIRENTRLWAALHTTCQIYSATAHTVKVITVHWGSVGWAACSPHLLSGDSSTLFHRSLSGLPAAHPFFWVIPQSPNLISPCLWLIPERPHHVSLFSQWNAIRPGFSEKKSCLRRNLFHKFCLRLNFFIKDLETVCLRLSVPLLNLNRN